VGEVDLGVGEGGAGFGWRWRWHFGVWSGLVEWDVLSLECLLRYAAAVSGKWRVGRLGRAVCMRYAHVLGDRRWRGRAWVVVFMLRVRD